eukprot:CAMPEP_0171306048 /NCGR_PEP_ID=MMETSP0816-20121228/15971_1 /TAXON_ID=420281 /ORGANISM="Proboscia inermis, Strain CCAP1064/1" /LENGTH=63 /DNA_ID=CAMNT_0011787341 /DNA_START=96 /DNA_END=283 /DNA_ORIENTATION=+
MGTNLKLPNLAFPAVARLVTIHNAQSTSFFTTLKSCSLRALEDDPLELEPEPLEPELCPANPP